MPTSPQYDGLHVCFVHLPLFGRFPSYTDRILKVHVLSYSLNFHRKGPILRYYSRRTYRKRKVV